jgi:hypothetical protein
MATRSCQIDARHVYARAPLNAHRDMPEPRARVGTEGALSRIPPRQEKRRRASEMLARKGAGSGRLWVFAQGCVWGEAWWRAVTVGERV